MLSSYAARSAWQWQSCQHFLIQGRARLEGKNQLFSGPFVLWASKDLSFVRADFSGPDGSVIISLLLNNDGCLVYQPQEIQAFFIVGGLPFGEGLLDVNAVISLIRTGFPLIPEQWKIVASADTSDAPEIRWPLTAASNDSAQIVLSSDQLFPSFSTDSFSLAVNSTSWHDSFNAWPTGWIFNSPSINAILRIRSIDTDRVPDPSVETMYIPFPTDTVIPSYAFWDSAFNFPVR